MRWVAVAGRRNAAPYIYLIAECRRAPPFAKFFRRRFFVADLWRNSPHAPQMLICRQVRQIRACLARAYARAKNITYYYNIVATP